SQKEISAIMQISEGSVEQLLMRGKENLKKRLKHIKAN
ncbi:MAG TPA: RNA polymerase sigma factor SigW, partial [Rikenellaceae bacterium]|nr:RNA polymerase sigma factor SigW [Rikenellaceae bacterium]